MNKYQEALNHLKTVWNPSNYYKKFSASRPIFEKDIAFLQELVDKESSDDNCPLKFEELKQGMWIWDNKYKCYTQIYDVKELANGEQKVIHSRTISDLDAQYEDDRYYEMEV